MKRIINGALATCRFELHGSFTFQRTLVSLVLAFFPPVMIGLLILGTQTLERRVNDVDVQNAMGVVQGYSTFAMLCLVSMVCLLSLLLWATSNVNSELEGKSWKFIASRPGGRISVFLGKFLAAFVVSFMICTISISLSVLAIDGMLHIPGPERLWLSTMGIYFLGCLIYSALFSMIGTLFIKRGMVVAAGYLVAADLILASVPGAMVNKLTTRFHLQEIGIQWLGWFLPGDAEREYRLMYGDAWPTWLHVVILLSATAMALGVGMWVIVSREYVTSDEA